MFGEITNDYPALLKDIEEMYDFDKKEFEKSKQVKKSKLES